MTSPYLDRPCRTLAQAVADRIDRTIGTPAFAEWYWPWAARQHSLEYHARMRGADINLEELADNGAH